MTVFKDEQINAISTKLNIPRTTVKEILSLYVWYIRTKMERGETVKFLNVCTMRVNNTVANTYETLAYVSDELAEYLSLSQILIQSVLTAYEDIIIEEVKSLSKFNIRGLVNLYLELYNGSYRLRMVKSSIYSDRDIRVLAVGSFKRKVEFTPGGDK